MKKDENFDASQRIDLKLLENSTHYLYGELCDENIASAIEWILYESLTAKEEKILTLYINSIGGDLYNAFALIDVMKASELTIRTVGIGAVMSSAFLIFASGSRGYRLASNNASFMSHQYSDSLTGKHHDLKATMKDGELLNKRMIGLLKDATGLPVAKVKAKLLPPTDVYLTAQEVIDLGAADYLFER
jgi:ATP-dependent Clp protease protease subunit